jgi:hypothetical protein
MLIIVEVGRGGIVKVVVGIGRGGGVKKFDTVL